MSKDIQYRTLTHDDLKPGTLILDKEVYTKNKDLARLVGIITTYPDWMREQIKIMWIKGVLGGSVTQTQSMDYILYDFVTYTREEEKES